MIDGEDEIPVDDITADIRAASEQLRTEETSEQKSDRARDEAGRFKAIEAAPVEAAAPIPDADQPIEQPQEQSRASEAPKGLSADIRAKWPTLDASIQAEFIRRDTAADTGARQWSEQRQTYETALAPVSEFAQRYNITPTEAITRLTGWQAALEQNPADAIRQLAQISGVDLIALVNGSPQPQAQQQFNPDLIFQNVQSLIDQKLTERDETLAIKSEIESFGQMRDQAGQIAHPHFGNEAVKKRMGVLLESGLATDMEDAYQQSIWSVSDIRSALQAPKPQANQAQIAKSKAAKVSPSGAPGNTAPKANGFDPKQSLDDDLREAIASLRH